jgi:amino acid transporter
MSTNHDTKLVRAIGRWSLSALMVNAIIGSGIFGLPSIVTHLLGPFGPWAYLVAAVGIGGGFPSFFGAVSRKFRTPYVSIVVFALVMFVLALLGTFRGNAVLSAVARLFTYGVVCAAVMTLRRKRPDANAFRLGAGPLVSGLGLAFVLALGTQMGLKEVMAIAGVMLVALLNWVVIVYRVENHEDRDSYDVPG